MGFLDRAKKLAGQAKELAEDALADAKARSASSAPGGATAGDPRLGTPYVPGMLGRPGWRERGLTDPAAVLPVDERERAGVPRSTKSEILEEPFGMGRRWSVGGRAAGLYYQLHPEHLGWEPPGGRAPAPDVPGASTATLDDGRALVFLGAPGAPVVLELEGIDPAAQASLARAVSQQLAAGL
jgi:hypothetical protein